MKKNEGTPKTLDQAIEFALSQITSGDQANIEQVLYHHIKDFLANRFASAYLQAEGPELIRLTNLYFTIVTREQL